MIQKILKLKISNKKLKYYTKKCNQLGIIICLFALIFTYYYFILLKKEIIYISLTLFELGLSIKIGGYISGIILDQYIE